jgi:hypothetical protein
MGSVAIKRAALVAVDERSPQCESVKASVNPTKPIQKKVRRSAPAGDASRVFRDASQTGTRIADAIASRRNARVTGPTSSTASRIAT